MSRTLSIWPDPIRDLSSPYVTPWINNNVVKRVNLNLLLEQIQCPLLFGLLWVVLVNKIYWVQTLWVMVETQMSSGHLIVHLANFKVGTISYNVKMQNSCNLNILLWICRNEFCSHFKFWLQNFPIRRYNKWFLHRNIHMELRTECWGH